MILKYRDGATWRFTDGFNNVVHKVYEAPTLIERYDAEVKAGSRSDSASVVWVGNPEDPNGAFTEGEKLAPEIAAVNKAFEMALEDLRDVITVDEFRSHCAIDAEIMQQATNICGIAMISGLHGDAAEIVFTNQGAYLLNDQGRTIERLA